MVTNHLIIQTLLCHQHCFTDISMLLHVLLVPGAKQLVFILLIMHHCKLPVCRTNNTIRHYIMTVFVLCGIGQFKDETFTY